MSTPKQAGEINGEPFYMTDLAFNERAIQLKTSDNRRFICALCRDDLTPGTHKVLMSNHRLFPNACLHAACVEETGGAVDAAHTLKSLYDECKAAKEKFIPLGWMGAWPN